jgi:hypothetical protein
LLGFWCSQTAGWRWSNSRRRWRFMIKW